MQMTVSVTAMKHSVRKNNFGTGKIGIVYVRVTTNSKQAILGQLLYTKGYTPK